jgi:ribosomal protein L3
VTIKNLEVVAVSENNITIKGLVPGKVGGTLEIVPAIK